MSEPTFEDAPDEFDVGDAFFNNLGGGAADDALDDDEPKPRKAPEKPAEGPADEPGDESPEKPAKAAQEAPEGLAGDDDEVELPIDGKAQKFTVKALREALAAKAAPAAAQPAQVERATKVLDRMVETAREAYAPYANVDWLSLSRDQSITQENFEALRADAMAAYQNLESVTKERTELTAEVSAAGQAAAQAATQAMVKELEDPEKGIKGFGPAMVQELLGFVQTQGVPELMNTTSAAMVRLIHQAMLYQQGQTKVAAQVKRVVEQPKRVIRPGGSNKSAPGANRQQAIQNLRKSTSSESITDAFMADLSR